MPTTPLLGITQVAQSQANKEAAINDAIVALEAATNANLEVDFAAANSVLLSTGQATGSFLFQAVAATADATLRFPVSINAMPTNRMVAVRNNSGFGLTVTFEGTPGSTIIIPDGQARLIALLNGTDVIVAAEPQTVVSFLALTDSPNAYAGQGGKFLAANLAENALEFIDAAVFPSFIDNAGKYLVVNGTEDGVEWVDIAAVTAFISLTDVPASYTGQAGKLAAVKQTEDGMEFIDTPDAEAVEYIAAAQWRIQIIESGTETQDGFGEVEFLDVDGIDLATGGTATAGSFDTGKEPAFAYDNDLSPGAGWLSDPAFAGTEYIGYDFAGPVTPRNIRLSPITGFPSYSPARILIEYFDGAVWVALGDRTAAPWVDTEAQTFKVNGVPLSSVADAPQDGLYYVRRNGAWEEAPAGSATSIASVAEVRAGTENAKAISPKGLFDAPAPVALTDGPSIALDGSLGVNFSVTLQGNRTLANPTNMKPGQSGIILVVQDVIGGRTLAFGSKYLFAGGAAASAVLTTTGNAVDVIAYFVRANGDLLCNVAKDYKA